MNIFPLRRREALAELRLPDEAFEHMPHDDVADIDQMEAGEETPVSPANELATAIIERDIADAVRADNPPPPEPVEMPAPLSQRHLETIERMVAHLKADEHRLERQIVEAKRQLADTQLARRGYERNSAELRKGIAVLVRLANTKPPAQRPRAARAAASEGLVRQATGTDGGQVTPLRPRTRRRKVH